VIQQFDKANSLREGEAMTMHMLNQFVSHHFDPHRSAIRNTSRHERQFRDFDPGKSALSVSGAIDQLGDSGFPDFATERSIAFLAANFVEFSVAELSAIPVDALPAILGHNSLRLSNEDALFDFIESRTMNERRSFGLFRFVRFQYLSGDCMKRFVDLTREFWDDIDEDLWAAVCSRLLLPVIECEHNLRATVGVVECSIGKQGIIEYLTEKAGGNVHAKDVVTVTASSSCCPLKNIVDVRKAGHFGTEDRPDSWICLDFKKLRIIPTHYSITTDHTAPGWQAVFLTSWVLEVGNDKKHWTEVDRHTNSPSLDGPDRTSVFSIATPKECRFVRLRMTGPAQGGLNCLELKAFELYGSVFGAETE
jgi:hypothetical protein